MHGEGGEHSGRLALGEDRLGRTLARLVKLLRARNPQSLEICALLHKHIATELEQDVRFVGFDAPHDFLVGYGLDHAENFRHLPYIVSLQ